MPLPRPFRRQQSCPSAPSLPPPVYSSPPVYCPPVQVVPGTNGFSNGGIPNGGFAQPVPTQTVTPSTSLRVEGDSQAHATSYHNDAQELVDAMSREAIPVDTAQSVVRTGRDAYGGVTTEHSEIKLDADHKLLERTSASGSWNPNTSTQVFYCDETGVVRDKSGKELGRLGFEAGQAEQLKLQRKPDGTQQGVFIAFSDRLSSCTFYPKPDGTSAGTGPQLFCPADRTLGGQPAVIAIGYPPGVDPARLSYTKHTDDAIVTVIERDAAGNASRGTRRSGLERAYSTTVEADPDQKRLESLSEALKRTKDQMRTTSEERDANYKITQAGGQRWEYLETTDPQTGVKTRRAFGVNADGKLLEYVGATGTADERTRLNGWRESEAPGAQKVQHLFIREDFTVMNKEGEIIGRVNPHDFTKSELEVKKNPDGSSSGMFLRKDLTILLANGTSVDYHAGNLGFGQGKAVLQFGTPPERAAVPLEPLHHDRASALLMDVNSDGGLVIDPAHPTVGTKPGITHYLSSGGAMRITVDDSKVDFKKLNEIRAELIELKKKKDAIADLPMDQQADARRAVRDAAVALQERQDAQDANFKVTIERRVHLASRGYDSSGQPESQSAWRKEPGEAISHPQLRRLFPAISGQEPPQQRGSSDRVAGANIQVRQNGLPTT